MSAFIVTEAHISYLVSAMLRWSPRSLHMDGCNTPQEVATVLARENAASVAARYSEEPVAVGCTFRLVPADRTNAVQALKAIDCYEYQACESPTWATSKAKAFCDSLRKLVIRKLPGYDTAAWEIA